MEKKEFEYKVEYGVDKKSGFVTATIPELNHVSSFGETFAEAEANIKEAALGYLEVMAEETDTIPIPASHSEGTYLKILVPVGI